MANNMKKLFSIAALTVCSAMSFGQTTKRFGDMKSWDNVVTGVSQIESNISAVSNDTVAIRSLIVTNCATKADATLNPVYTNGSATNLVGYTLGSQTNSPVASLSYAEHLDAIIEDLKTNAVNDARWERGAGTGAIVMPTHPDNPDNKNSAVGIFALAHGLATKATGDYSHAEGYGAMSTAVSSHAEGNATTASGYASHAEGYGAMSTADYSHAEGSATTASEYASHAEGSYTRASGESSHAEGSYTIASGYTSHAECDGTEASGYASHAEGSGTVASDDYSHAEGGYTIASGPCSHAEGSHTEASGDSSHAEGSYTEASGFSSHAAGVKSLATNNTSFVWQGLQGEPWVDYDPDSTQGYGSHGDGTFNVSPVGGASGFWVGNQTLADIAGGSGVVKYDASGEILVTNGVTVLDSPWTDNPPRVWYQAGRIMYWGADEYGVIGEGSTILEFPKQTAGTIAVREDLEYLVHSTAKNIWIERVTDGATTSFRIVEITE